MSNEKPRTLVKGVDYYLDGTRFVFTASYHLKRGYCCNSRCRHCPYGLAPGETAPAITIVGLPEPSAEPKKE